MSNLSHYIYESIVNTTKFKRHLDTFRIWKNLHLLEKRHLWEKLITPGAAPPAVHIEKNIPSHTKQQTQIDTRIEKQVIQLLSKWKQIDQSEPDSYELYKQRYSEEYNSQSDAELIALEYKTPFDRTKVNMTEVYSNALSRVTNRKNVEFQEYVQSRKYFENDSEREQVNPKHLEQLTRLQSIEKERMEKLSKQIDLPWQLFSAPSTIKRAGTGLFIRGKCPRGTVIGLYPGMTYASTLVKQLNLWNDNLRQCFSGKEGGTYVNGSLTKERFFNTMHNHESPQIQDTETPWYGVDDTRREKEFGHFIGNRFVHPFAQLHLVNHAGDLPPNAIIAPFTVTSSFPQSLLCYVPNKHFQPPFVLLSDVGMIRTIVFIAQRDIEDEEVLIDYQMNPYKQPQWYVACDLENDKRTWKN